MTDSMVERVARAIYSRAPGPDGTEIFAEEPWRACLPAARAAIEAMREPTDDMLLAAQHEVCRRTHELTSEETYLAMSHRAMIDAALAEPVPK